MTMCFLDECALPSFKPFVLGEAEVGRLKAGLGERRLKRGWRRAIGILKAMKGKGGMNSS